MAEIGEQLARKREIYRRVAEIRLLRAGKGNRHPPGAQRLECRWLLGQGEPDADAALAGRTRVWRREMVA